MHASSPEFQTPDSARGVQLIDLSQVCTLNAGRHVAPELFSPAERRRLSSASESASIIELLIAKMLRLN
jgi:hypothetical protein